MNSQVRVYIKSGGGQCLYCNASDIEGESVDVEDGKCYQDIHCNRCFKEWTDVYTLTDVEEKE